MCAIRSRWKKSHLRIKSMIPPIRSVQGDTCRRMEREIIRVLVVVNLSPRKPPARVICCWTELGIWPIVWSRLVFYTVAVWSCARWNYFVDHSARTLANKYVQGAFPSSRLHQRKRSASRLKSSIYSRVQLTVLYSRAVFLLFSKFLMHNCSPLLLLLLLLPTFF